MGKYAIAIHGGAGTILKSSLTPELEKAYLKALADAIHAGETVLKSGGSSLDAVESAVISLEDCPLFNAGKGSVFTHDGKHEMDACIMYGKDLNSGAIAGVSQVKNPVSLAKAVMQKTEHVLLTGAGAIDFAKQINIPFENDEYFYVESRFQQLKQAKESDKIILDHTGQSNEKKFGTVGAVALDINGHLAAATSTGGMTNKKYGRVGDAPIIGAGTYANDKTCAISCTGHGEYFLRAVVAYDISCLMEYKGMTLQQACEYVVNDKLVKFGGEGGLVAVDVNGNMALPFNSEGMYRASKSHNTNLLGAIYK
ncbi:MAG: isoaspartyl peptidase/L-asparaginase [Sphingobacteriaceae bacterium]|nr:isoaspartyl peptidase/L-asparaginase [Sphingobacteriaceae bacterium]